MTADDPTAPLGDRNVLIVEDRYLIASELEGEVRRLGGRVVGPARTVRDAEALLKSHAVDFALLDVNLDGDLVFPLAETLSRSGQPFAFLTGYDEAMLPAKWRDRPRLCKPVSARVLRDELLRLSRTTSKPTA